MNARRLFLIEATIKTYVTRHQASKERVRLLEHLDSVLAEPVEED